MAEEVLRPAFAKQAGGVYDQDLVLALRRLLAPEHDHAASELGAIEQVWGETDDGLNHIIFKQRLTNVALGGAKQENGLRTEQSKT